MGPMMIRYNLATSGRSPASYIKSQTLHLNRDNILNGWATIDPPTIDPRQLTPRELTPRQLTPRQLTPRQLTPRQYNLIQ